MIRASARRRLSLAVVLLFGATFLGMSPARAQEADTVQDEAAIQQLLESVAHGFAQKDVKRIKEGLVENFAGPFELPKLTERVLNQVVQGSQSISANYDLGPMEVHGHRAVALVDIDVVFDFGPKQQAHKGPVLAWFVREGADWSILSFERLATDWSIDRGAPSIVWEDEGLSFPAPEEWYGHPLKSMQARKAVVFISPDLKANTGVGVIGLPVPVELKTIVDQQRGVGKLVPGARFVGEEKGTLGGVACVTTTIEAKAGPDVTRAVTHMAIRGNALYVVSMSVTPAADVQQYMPVLAALSKGFTFTRPAEPVPAVDDSPAGRRDVSEEFGLELTAPEGWRVQPLDEKTANGRGWLFAVHLKAAGGDSYALVGARDLPQNVPPAQLQQAEMGNLRSVVEDITVDEEEDMQVGGKAARSWVCTFEVGRKQKRREVLAMSGKRLFFIIADAVPASAYAQVSPKFDEIIKSVKITYTGE